MTISVNQQVDFLWKKIGFGLAKTSLPADKDATNESIISQPFIPGDKIWAESNLIPPVKPLTTSGVVDLEATECTMDITAVPNRTWLTNSIDWIPISFGSTYLVKVFLDAGGSLTPETTGVQLYGAGSNNNDEWYFDYSAGVLHFIGDNLPPQDFTNKKIYIVGARYIGVKGITNSASSTIGNITITGDTISSTNGIILAPFTGQVNVNGSTIGNVAYPTLPTDAATSQYVNDQILALHPNTIYQGDSIVRLSDPTGNAGVLTITIDGNVMSTWSNSSVNIANLTISGNTITSTNNINITPAVGSVVTTTSTTAWKIPSGTTAERPLNPEAGYTRFNTTFGGLEVFNGTDWSSSQSQIAISHPGPIDGIQDVYSLTQATQAQNILVMINGVVQDPDDAYVVLSGGTSIQFAEPPKITDKVEVRYLSQMVSPIANIPASAIIDIPPITVGTVNMVIDSFPISTYRSSKYTLSVVDQNGEAQMTEVLLTHNGDTEAKVLASGSTFTGGSTTVLTYSADINVGSGMCQLMAQSSTPNTEIKMQKTYFTI